MPKTHRGGSMDSCLKATCQKLKNTDGEISFLSQKYKWLQIRESGILDMAISCYINLNLYINLTEFYLLLRW